MVVERKSHSGHSKSISSSERDKQFREPAKGLRDKEGVKFVREQIRDANKLQSSVVQKIQTESLGMTTELCFSGENDSVDTLAESFQLNPRLQRVIPVALSGKSVFIQSATGSGKTLAYLVPLVEQLLRQSAEEKITRASGTLAIILTPTKELALQVDEVLTRLASPFPWLVHSAFSGGFQRDSEKRRLREGVTVIVATPGRLLDHLRSTAALSVKGLRALVVDECDRLLDQGFLRDLSAIVDILEERRGASISTLQTVLCSATHGGEQPELYARLQRNPVEVRVSSDNGAAPAAESGSAEGLALCPQSITLEKAQAVLPPELRLFFSIIPVKMRLMALLGFICQAAADAAKAGRGARVIVFVSSMDAAVFLRAALLGIRALPQDDASPAVYPGTVTALHGSMELADRRAALTEFVAPDREATGDSLRARAQCARVLITTDVAARGLDFGGTAVDWILQFEAPTDFRTFVHRCGRTARIGRQGSACAFLNPSEQEFAVALARVGLPSQSLDAEACMRGVFALWPPEIRPPSGAHLLERCSVLHNGFARVVEHSPFLYDAALRAFQSSVKAYQVRHSELRSFFPTRDLHTGHLAASFCLEGSPTDLLNQRVARSSRDLAVRKQEKAQAIREHKQAKREAWLLQHARHASRKAHRIGSRVTGEHARDQRRIGDGARHSRRN